MLKLPGIYRLRVSLYMYSILNDHAYPCLHCKKKHRFFLRILWKFCCCSDRLILLIYRYLDITVQAVN